MVAQDLRFKAKRLGGGVGVRFRVWAGFGGKS